MTDFEKAVFRHCFDVIHGAIGMLRETMEECGNPPAEVVAANFEQYVFLEMLHIRKRYDIPYEEGK
jgi:hypothetical protein